MKAVALKPPYDAGMPRELPQELSALTRALNELLTGKHDVAETILCALGSQGHVLLEDVPGVGKTTVIKALAKLLGLPMARIQCTSDLLPSDILGVEVYSPQKDSFSFHPGPIFASILFVDELNRCSPRTQSALLEAMAEGSVTVSRKSFPLPKPFLVFATQNPSDFTGTYALPESQLDRFAAKVRMGYPLHEKEKQILSGAKRDPLVDVQASVVGPDFTTRFESAAESVQVSERLLAYAMQVIEATRKHGAVVAGVSTRGAVAWLRLAKARAVLQGREYVIPDDLVAFADRALAHRLVLRGSGDASAILKEILTKTPVE